MGVALPRVLPLVASLGLVAWACAESTTFPAPESSEGEWRADWPALVTAQTTAFGVPAVLTTMFQIRNGSLDPLELSLAGACRAGLRVYVDRDGNPVWDSRGLERCRNAAPPLHHVIAPGDSVQEYFDADEAEVLGDSLSPGMYYVAAMLVRSDGAALEVPTGRVDLTGATLVDVSVRRGEQVVVPGTGLRIGLLSVTNDQRCAVRDEAGNEIVCIWQGNADLEISLAAPGLEAEVAVVRSGFAPRVDFGPFTIHFFGLAPERIEGVQIEQDAYVATFRVVVP